MYDPNHSPISLAYIQHIIDRIHNRYPLVDKSDIAIVVKAFFESIRDILFAGDSISVSGFFTNMSLYDFNKIRKNKYSRIVKVKLNTPRKFKYE